MGFVGVGGTPPAPTLDLPLHVANIYVPDIIIL